MGSLAACLLAEACAPEHPLGHRWAAWVLGLCTHIICWATAKLQYCSIWAPKPMWGHQCHTGFDKPIAASVRLVSRLLSLNWLAEAQGEPDDPCTCHQLSATALLAGSC